MMNNVKKLLLLIIIIIELVEITKLEFFLYPAVVVLFIQIFP